MGSAEDGGVCGSLGAGGGAAAAGSGKVACVLTGGFWADGVGFAAPGFIETRIGKIQTGEIAQKGREGGRGRKRTWVAVRPAKSRAGSAGWRG
ncbi:MAG: hypothetical protein WDO18_09860 [Acidobacteriota bacterium]